MDSSQREEIEAVLEEIKSGRRDRMAEAMEAARRSQEAVARADGVSPQHVRREIEKVLTVAWKKSRTDPSARAGWEDLMGPTDRPPTPEEFIAQAALYLKRQRSS